MTNLQLGVVNVHSDVGETLQLSDRTWVFPQMLFDVENNWKEWIGSIRAEALQRSNLVLLRRVSSKNPQILDHEHKILGRDLSMTFHLLQLSGISFSRPPRALLGNFSHDLT